MKYIYGPVPSRRLGFSLGIDMVPYKTCSFDCIYCQLGKTTNKTIERKEYVNEKEILKALNQKLASFGGRIDYITFGGSGEPTLNSRLGSLIRTVKKVTTIPVAVLTNSSLLYQAKVREDLKEADLVLPSFSAGTKALFEKVNRPISGEPASITLDLMIEGLNKFCKEFKGLTWLEIMLIKGINDKPEHIRKLKSILSPLSFNKIHLNTVVRPPTERFACPLDRIELYKIRTLLGHKAEIVAEFTGDLPRSSNTMQDRDNTKQKIYEIIKRRSVTLKDIADVLPIEQNELKKELANLEKEGKIKQVHLIKEKHGDEIFYTATGSIKHLSRKQTRDNNL